MRLRPRLGDASTQLIDRGVMKAPRIDSTSLALCVSVNGLRADGAEMLERRGAIAERVVALGVEVDAAAVLVLRSRRAEALARGIGQLRVDQLVPKRESHRREADAGRESQDDREPKGWAA